jgi:hypothetical protein
MLQEKNKPERLKESKVQKLKLIHLPKIKLKPKSKTNISSNLLQKKLMRVQFILDSKQKSKKLKEEEIEEVVEEVEVEEAVKREVMHKLPKEEEESQMQKLH